MLRDPARTETWCICRLDREFSTYNWTRQHGPGRQELLRALRRPPGAPTDVESGAPYHHDGAGKGERSVVSASNAGKRIAAHACQQPTAEPQWSSRRRGPDGKHPRGLSASLASFFQRNAENTQTASAPWNNVDDGSGLSQGCVNW